MERELQRSKEDFIAEHIAKYGTEDFPPAWKMLEIVSFGTLTKLFINSSDTQAKKKIARSFDVRQAEVLESWIKSAYNNYIHMHVHTCERIIGKWLS